MASLLDCKKENTMKQILIHKLGKNTFRADPTWKSGSPQTGNGKTRIEALIQLLRILDYEVVIDDEGTTYDFKGRNHERNNECEN